MLLRIVLIAAVFVASAASAKSKQVQRAALVPHQRPIQSSGQPMGDARSAVVLGNTTLLADPDEAPNANAGIHIPKYHLNGGIRLRMSPRLSLALIYDRGFDKGSSPITKGLAEVDGGDVSGYGFRSLYSAELTPTLRLGVATEVLFYSVPWVEISAGSRQDHDTVSVWALALIPSWQIAPNLFVFASFTARNHPTIERVALDMPTLFEDEVRSGPGNVIISAGLEYVAANGIRAMFHAYNPIQSRPARYGPAIGLTIAIPLTRDRPRTSAVPPNAPPPPTPPTTLLP